MRKARFLALALSAGLAFALPGCSGDGDMMEVADTPGPEQRPDQPDAPDALDQVAGSYELITDIDLGSDAFASDDLIEILQNIREAPITTTLIAGAEELGIPSGAILWLESFLEGNLPESFTDALDNLAANIDEALGSFELVSHLDVQPGSSPWAAQHTVVGVNVSFAGVEASLDTSEKAQAVDAFVELNGSVLTVSDHALSVPVGEALAQILDTQLATSISPGATSLADALSTVADCQSLPLLDFGDPNRLRDICEAGIVNLADGLASALDNIGDLDVEMSISGSADASDSDSDGRFDTLTGSWGEGDEALPFEGHRM